MTVAGRSTSKGFLLRGLSSFPEGCLNAIMMWLLGKWFVRQSKAEAIISFTTLLRSHAASLLQYTIDYTALLNVKGEWIKGWIPWCENPWGPSWRLATISEINSFPFPFNFFFPFKISFTWNESRSASAYFQICATDAILSVIR